MIFIVSELYYPEETSTGYILTKIAEGLVGNFPVQIVTGPADYSGYKETPDSEIRNNVRIDRIRGLRLGKNRIVSRILRSTYLSLKLAAKTWSMLKKGDVVLVVTNPAPLFILMSLVCRFCRCPLIILIHDVFPENMRAAQLLRGDTLLFRILVRFFNIVYKASDHIIVIGRDMRSLMKSKINRCYPEISVITNWADTEDIYPDERFSNKIIKDLQLESRFIVQFSGNLGRVQGIEQIVETAEILRNKNVHFIFIGNGAKKRWLIEQVSARKLNNITVLDTLPRAEQQLFLNACDIGLVSLASGMTGLGVPSKTYNILAAGKPVIAVVDSLSEVGLLVQEERVGWVVEPADPEGLASAICEARNFQGLDEMGRKARALAESKYSLSKIISKYQDVISHYAS